MDEVGFAHFSAREVAKRIGYSIGTIYNVFGSYDAFILAINGRTLALWRDHLLRRLEKVQRTGCERPSPPISSLPLRTATPGQPSTTSACLRMQRRPSAIRTKCGPFLTLW